MRIRWSPEAADDIERNVARTLFEGITSLIDFPQRGRVGRIEGSRELVFAPLP